MELNDIEIARAKRELKKICDRLGIDQNRDMHQQLSNAIHDGRLNNKSCCEGKCNGHGVSDAT